jgi:glycosyltransferase involved in cell wall biosynthesis
MPSVSVVVPTYARVESLRRTLPSVLDDTATAEVVVVVDGPDDGTTSYLKELAETDQRVQFFRVDGVGAGASRQAGADAATHEVVLFLDDDVLPDPGLVSGHARWHAGGEHLLVMGYTPVELPDRRRPGDFATFIFAAEYESACQDFERDPATIPHNVWSGNMSVRRADLSVVAFHDRTFSRLYHEDQDLGLRWLAAGYNVVFDRTLSSHHLHKRSLDNFLRDSRSQGYARWQLHERHRDLLGPLPADEFTRGLPAILRPVVRAGGASRMGGALSSVLVAGIRAAGPLHLFGMETTLARLLRRIEQQRGAVGTSPASRR